MQKIKKMVRENSKMNYEGDNKAGTLTIENLTLEISYSKEVRKFVMINPEIPTKQLQFNSQAKLVEHLLERYVTSENAQTHLLRDERNLLVKKWSDKINELIKNNDPNYVEVATNCPERINEIDDQMFKLGLM